MMQSFLTLNRPWQGTGNRSSWKFSGNDEEALRGCLDQLVAFETPSLEDRWEAAITFGALEGQGRRAARTQTAERAWTIDGALALADALPESLADLREDLIASFGLRKAGWQGDTGDARSRAISYDFMKHKAPRGVSWPLRRSQLDTALLDAGIADLVGIVHYWVAPSGRENPRLIGVRYHGKPASGYYAERVAITVWTVDSKMRQHAETRMLTQALPQACRWIAAIRERPATWRSGTHGLDYRLTAD